MNKALVMDCSYIITDYDYYKEIKYNGRTRMKRVGYDAQVGSGRESIIKKPNV